VVFKHLLVPTEFSEPANYALRYAIEESVFHHAKVTLLHVLSPDIQTDVHTLGGVDPVAGGRLGGSAFPSQLGA